MKKPALTKRLEAFAAQAYLLVHFFDQGNEGEAGLILSEMSETLEEDKKLAQHLFPGLMKLCQEKNLAVEGGRLRDSEKH